MGLRSLAVAGGRLSRRPDSTPRAAGPPEPGKHVTMPPFPVHPGDHYSTTDSGCRRHALGGSFITESDLRLCEPKRHEPPLCSPCCPLVQTSNVTQIWAFCHIGHRGVHLGAAGPGLRRDLHARPGPAGRPGRGPRASGSSAAGKRAAAVYQGFHKELLHAGILAPGLPGREEPLAPGPVPACHRPRRSGSPRLRRGREPSVPRRVPARVRWMRCRPRGCRAGGRQRR